MSARVIELDTTGPWKPPPRRESPRWRVRTLVVLLILITPLSATRIDRSYVPLLTVEASDAALFVGGDTAYAVPVEYPQAGLIRAYALPSGRLRWEKMIRDVGAGYWHVDGDVLFETVLRGGPGGHMWPSVLRAIDPATGDARWERTGVQVWLANSKTAVLVEPVVEEIPLGPTERFGIPRIAAVYGVDPVSGREIWSRPLTGPFAFSWRAVELTDSWGLPRRLPLAGRAPIEGLALAELSPTAELRMTNLNTGVTSLPVQLALTSVPEYFEIVDGVLSFETGGELIAYDVDANRMLPRVTTSGRGFQCGRLYFCAPSTSGASGIEVLDRRTGARLVTLPPSQVVGTMGDRLLLRNDPQSAVRNTTVVDLAGDRVPRTFASWGSPAPFDDHRVIVSGHSLKVRATTVAVLDLDTGRAVVVGEAGKLFVPPDCRRFGDYVVCASHPHYVVWQLPAELRLRGR